MLDLGRSWPQGPRGVGLAQTESGSLAQESTTARKVRSEVTLSAVGRLGAVPPTVGPCGLVESQRTSIMRPRRSAQAAKDLDADPSRAWASRLATQQLPPVQRLEALAWPRKGAV
mmetsp:Transcript_43911/g.116027  ORF Transcript_43911/g.116027 Transcript_43911/m.116027 type:complete len:115 (-) Transcript_43911:455-799(-)